MVGVPASLVVSTDDVLIIACVLCVSFWCVFYYRLQAVYPVCAGSCIVCSVVFKLIGFMWLLVGLFVVEFDWAMIYHSDWNRLWFTAINIEDT